MYSPENFKSNGKFLSRGGVLPFLTPEHSRNVCSLVNDLLAENPKENEFNFIFSQDIGISPKKWGDNIQSKNLRNLRMFNDKNLNPEHLHLASKPLKPNHLLQDLVNNFWKKIRPHILYKHMKWEPVIGIEPITTKSYTGSGGFWNQNNYSYFSGKIDTNVDQNILYTAIRETREEGKIIFSQKIFNPTYQKGIRELYELKNIPNVIDHCLNEKNNTYSRVFLLFMDDIRYGIREDEIGKYVYIDI